MSLSTLALSQWILARLMPPAQAEALIGDLLEERRLRPQAGSHVSVAGWYWRQLASSVPVLLWASMRRGAWLVTVVTAVASFIAAFGIMRVLALLSALSPMTTSKSVRAVVAILSFAAALAACGYVAASIRLGAARLLAFLVFAATCAMLAISTSDPLWYEGSLLVLGPVATIAGATLSGVRRNLN
jgi:hypothetical protein